MIHSRQWALFWRRTIFSELSTCLGLWIVIKKQTKNPKRWVWERMEARSELLSFQRHFCKHSPTSVTMECWSVLMIFWFGKGCICHVSQVFLFLRREAQIKHSWSRMQGFLYWVVFIKQNCLVWSVLKALLPQYSLKRIQEKILFVFLGMGSYFVLKGYALDTEKLKRYVYNN